MSQFDLYHSWYLKPIHTFLPQAHISFGTEGCCFTDNQNMKKCNSTVSYLLCSEIQALKIYSILAEQNSVSIVVASLQMKLYAMECRNLFTLKNLKMYSTD